MKNNSNIEKKAVRRSFYFSPKNLDLIEFLESNPNLTPNEFLIEIIRSAKNNYQNKQTDDMTNTELYHQLESLISTLKIPQNTDNSHLNPSIELKQSEQIPIIPKKSLREMDDAL